MRNIVSRSIWFTAALVLLLAGTAHADHHETWGPPVGATLPAGLEITTQDARALDVRKLAGDKGVAIAFVRSADWCPFCKRQIIELNKSRADFARRGVNLVALSYDSVDILRTFSDEHDIQFTLASDPESRVIDALGIRNTEHEAGSTGYGIPHPGIMVFDASGTLVAKFAEEGYRKRPAVEQVLETIDARL